MRQTTVLLILGVWLWLTPLSICAAENMVGVVDGMDIIAKSSEGKRVQENIRKKAEELGLPLVQQRQNLAKQLEEFQRQAAKMKEPGRRIKFDELDKKLRDYDRQKMEAEKQLRDYQDKEMAPLLKKLEMAVKTVAQESKLILVLDKRHAGILFLEPTLDLTEKVRSKFEQ